MVAEVTVDAVGRFVGMSNAIVAGIMVAVLGWEVLGNVGKKIAPLRIGLFVLNGKADPVDVVARQYSLARCQPAFRLLGIR